MPRERGPRLDPVPIGFNTFLFRVGGGTILPCQGRTLGFPFEHAVPYERASPTPPHPQERAGKHYSYDRRRYLINAVSFMKAFITPEASKPWERKAAARSSAVAVS